jgi:site-specific recombinase XerD
MLGDFFDGVFRCRGTQLADAASRPDYKVCPEAAKLQLSACRQLVAAIRSLLRFLVARGVVLKGLEGAVPPVRTWRHSSLPRHISPAEVERMIEACDPVTPRGLRGRAVVMLLAQLVLRAGRG